MMILFFDREENSGKRRKCWLLKTSRKIDLAGGITGYIDEISNLNQMEGFVNYLVEKIVGKCEVAGHKHFLLFLLKNW